MDLEERNIIYNEDCKITLKRLQDKSIDGIITSPPYNINTERSDCYYNNGIFIKILQNLVFNLLHMVN